MEHADLLYSGIMATAVILSNLAMDERREVYFNEIEKMGLAKPAGKKT
jgi:hypothetical protein